MRPLFSNVLSDYAHYARLMAALAVLAYNDPMTSIPQHVEPLGVQVVWGPAEKDDGLGVSYTRAFITRDTASNVYTVVIRGTNPLSLLSWTLEDFDVSKAVPFNSIVPSAPADALIAQGTYYGLAYLAELRDPHSGKTMVEYLLQAQPDTVLVTGHSLGGTLVPPTFAYLHAWLTENDSTVAMAPFSLAGLSPGNAAFNTYFNGLFDPQLQWRFHNTLDVAPYLWWSLDGLRNVYSANGLSWGWPESEWLTHKFSQAAPIGYAQPAGGWALEGTFDSTFVSEHLWMAQAAHQHHGCTYFALVSAVVPADTAQPSRNFQTVCPQN